MNLPRKRPELLLAAVGLIAAAGVTIWAAANPGGEASWEDPAFSPGVSRRQEDQGPWIDPFGEDNGSESPVVPPGANDAYQRGPDGFQPEEPPHVESQPGEVFSNAPGEAYEKPSVRETQAVAPRAETTQKPQALFPLNINTAAASQLEALPGIGPVKAQAIVDYRNANGRYLSPHDLINVTGIGAKTLEKLLPYVVV